MRNIGHQLLMDGKVVTDLKDGDHAGLMVVHVDPDGVALPTACCIKVWRTDRGLHFNRRQLLDILGLTVKLKTPSIMDVQSLRQLPEQAHPCLADHQYLGLEQAIMVAATAEMIVGFHPLSQLLLQPALHGHWRRVAQRLPAALGQPPTLGYDEQEMGFTVDDLYCNAFDGQVPLY